MLQGGAFGWVAELNVKASRVGGGWGQANDRDGVQGPVPAWDQARVGVSTVAHREGPDILAWAQGGRLSDLSSNEGGAR